MKRMLSISLTVLVITLLVVVAWKWFWPLPDWVVRVNGITMILSVMLFTFSAVRLRMTR